jgi:tetraacyldisaccharide 4'-kinase
MSSTSGLRSLLAPLTPLYRFGLARRERRFASGREPVRRLRYPVISIGNLSTGGAGKTPLTIALAQALSSRGFAVDVLSRGYKRQSTLAARVDPEGTADEFGDEPLLIARQSGVPVYVAQQRYDAGLVAESSIDHPASAPPKAELAPSQVVHVLDDGFQHRQLHRDIDILLLNRANWLDRLLPAGNLREDRSAATRADVIAIPTNEKELESDLRAWGWNGPVWRLHRSMEIPPVEGPVLAFCGIARPEQFFAGIVGAGVILARHRIFPDHHRYSARDLDRLAAQVRTAGASTLLTTEKDAVRLAGLRSPLPIATVHLRTQIENEPAALDWIENRLKTVSSEQHTVNSTQ